MALKTTWNPQERSKLKKITDCRDELNTKLAQKEIISSLKFGWALVRQQGKHFWQAACYWHPGVCLRFQVSVSTLRWKWKDDCEKKLREWAGDLAKVPGNVEFFFLNAEERHVTDINWFLPEIIDTYYSISIIYVSSMNLYILIEDGFLIPSAW